MFFGIGKVSQLALSDNRLANDIRYGCEVYEGSELAMGKQYSIAKQDR